MSNRARVLAAVAVAVVAGTWTTAPATAKAAPPESSKTTWTEEFPSAGTLTGCVDPAPTSSCTHIASAERSGAVDLTAEWTSNAEPGAPKVFGRAYALGDVGGWVSVPRGATTMTVTAETAVTRELAARSTPGAVSFFDQSIYALPPRCWELACGHRVSATLASSTPVTGAPQTVAAGTTLTRTLAIEAPAGQSLEKGVWTIRSRFMAYGQNAQDLPLQEATASGAVDVTSMTVDIGVPARR